MADTKVSALAAASALDGTEVFPVVQGGVSEKATLSQVKTFVDQRVVNCSVANQTFAAADAYVTGSNVLIPSGRLQAKSFYTARFQITKTSTTGSTGTPVITVRLGTAGTTADTARCTLTFAAQTAVADVGLIEVFATFRTVGSGTTAVLQAVGILDHQLATTGLSTLNSSVQRFTSAGFDSTVANLQIGFSFNGGASFAGNTDLVQAELGNLT